jgi:hypothetical protein
MFNSLDFAQENASAFFPAYDQVHLTLGEFSPSYPTFDGNFKLMLSCMGYTTLSQQ